MTGDSASVPLPTAVHDSDVTNDLLCEVLRGLRANPRSLPPKLFYDELGAALFECITKLPEYYLTRAEVEILEARAGEIAQLAGPSCTLVEYGAGAGTKVRFLLDAMARPSAYIPIDICATQLRAVACEIGAAYPGLTVHPLAADYTRLLTLPVVTGRRVAFFPGSTIGNLSPLEAIAFLRRVRRVVSFGGALIIGIDRVKDPQALHSAYNDAQGVTAAFNLNVLARLNRELGANFRLDHFSHRAFFNEAANRIEMHLVSRIRQTVTIARIRIRFEPGETIWTESSYKYDHARLHALVRRSGFTVARLWTDSASRFWVAFLQAA